MVKRTVIAATLLLGFAQYVSAQTAYPSLYRPVGSGAYFTLRPRTTGGISTAESAWEARRKRAGAWRPSQQGIRTATTKPTRSKTVGSTKADRRPSPRRSVEVPATAAPRRAPHREQPRELVTVMHENMRVLIRQSLNAPYCTGTVCNTLQTGFRPGDFVSYLYRQIGQELANDPRTLWRRVGIPVTGNGFAPGDLLFFRVKSAASGGERLFVGVYSGQGRFAYPSFGLKRVVQSNLRLPFWRTRYIGARRIIGTIF